MNHAAINSAANCSAPTLWVVRQPRAQTRTMSSYELLEKVRNGQLASTARARQAYLNGSYAPLAAVVPEVIAHVLANKQRDLPRTALKAEVKIGRGDVTATGQSIDISTKGMLIEATDMLFNIGDVVSVTFSNGVAGGSFTETGRIVRRLLNGYGLHFDAPHAKTTAALRDYIIDQETKSVLKLLID